MSDYWESLGNRSPDFWAGVKEGVTAYAIWKDDDQLVGCMERPLKEVLAKIDEVAGKVRVVVNLEGSGKTDGLERELSDWIQQWVATNDALKEAREIGEHYQKKAGKLESLLSALQVPDLVQNEFLGVWGAVLHKYAEHSEEKGDSFQDVDLNHLRAKLSEEFREVCTAISNQTEYDEVVDLILVGLMLGSRLRDEKIESCKVKEVIDDGEESE